MSSELNYYSIPGCMTVPGPHGSMLENLPVSIADLCKVVQGSTIHIFWAERYGIVLPEERKAEVQLRTLERRLKRMADLDPRPLTETRSLEKRIVGNCRDFSLLMVSILRHQGVPARARCGFGAYFMPNHFEDHWVCEYWNPTQKRWVLVDAQLDAFQCDQLKIGFDPLDVPRDQFITGGKAWQMCRAGQAEPDAFGIFDMHGLGFVRGDFVRDVASLNKIELLPWDCWGIIDSPDLDDPHDLSFLDRLAALSALEVPDFEALQTIYESDPRIKVGNTIHSYTASGMATVDIGQ